MNSPDRAVTVFREATERDLRAILALLADDPLGKYRELALPEGAEIAAPYKAAFDAILTDPRNRMVIAELEGAVAGCLQLTFIPGLTYTGGERALIEGVRVALSMRGRGIGKALIRHAIGLARQRGSVLVQLTSDKRRSEAHAFYRSLGFVDSHVGMKLAL